MPLHEFLHRVHSALILLLPPDALQGLFFQKEDFDLVVSDVDMPGMTGFDLVVKVRSNQRLKHLPLILVTGQEHNDDRQRGLQLGASAYLNKSEFDEGVLLESVERLVGEA